MTKGAFRGAAVIACVVLGASAGAFVARLRRPAPPPPIETRWIARLFQDGEPRGCATLVRDRRTAVTCDHVLTASDRCVLEYPDGVEIGATVIERGDADDVAILRLDADAPAAPRPFAASAPVAGATVFLCTRWGGATAPSAAAVSAPARTCWTLPDLDEYAEYLSIDRPGEQGTSGSAWVDAGGALVGMQDGIFWTNPAVRTSSGAVPSAVIAARLDHAPVVRGSLRVAVFPTSLLLPDPKRKPGPEGLMVMSIRAGRTSTYRDGIKVTEEADAAWSPLLKANVGPGAVITAIDGAPVATLDDWWKLVSTRPPGTPMKLDYTWGSPPLSVGATVVTITPRKRAR